MPRGRKSGKKLTSEQKNAIKLIRSAERVRISVHGVSFKVSRNDAIKAVECGKFTAACIPQYADEEKTIMTGFHLWLASVVKEEKKEEEKPQEKENPQSAEQAA